MNVPTWIDLRVGASQRGRYSVVRRAGIHHALLITHQWMRGWKRVVNERHHSRTIALDIPPGALIVVHDDNKKCRTNISVASVKQGVWAGPYYGGEYRDGEINTAAILMTELRCTCARGIHFFFAKRDADNFQI